MHSAAHRHRLGAIAMSLGCGPRGPLSSHSALCYSRTAYGHRVRSSDWLHAGGAGCRSGSRSSPHLSLRTAAAPAAVHGTGQHARPIQKQKPQMDRHGRTVQPGFWNNYVHKSVFSAPAPGSVLAAAWPDQPVRVRLDHPRPYSHRVRRPGGSQRRTWSGRRSRCRFICNPVVAGWRCMAASK
eukprot:SAG25_NODE_119_length_14756_cov_696.499898_4_plen_183_part_00